MIRIKFCPLTAALVSKRYTQLQVPCPTVVNSAAAICGMWLAKAACVQHPFNAGGNLEHSMASMQPNVLTDRLQRHVGRLAGEIGEHKVLRPQAVQAAEAYIRFVWHGRAYSVATQEYTAAG